MQRRRAVVESNAVFGTEIFGKRLLKAFDRRPQDELAARDDLMDRLVQFLRDAAILGRQIEEGNGQFGLSRHLGGVASLSDLSRADL